jgi:hypothetical protein
MITHSIISTKGKGKGKGKGKEKAVDSDKFVEGSSQDAGTI